ncbi:DUF2513 domain-containing protein [Rhodobacteraceae bacterium R_SAG10]|nr:DUF2513 domain-containing protein [Rhodobacteraceae bacterium R_SAG10]
MKRDYDYIRELLFEIEGDPSHIFLASLTIGASEEAAKKHYHAELLCDAGFLSKVNDGGVYRLTSQGHDYIEVIRDNSVWNYTKDGAKKIGGATLGMMAEIATAYLKREIAEKLGINL